jgi:hypothetical protein
MVYINTTLSSHHSHFIKPLKMDLTEGSETSANINQTPGKHPKVDTLETMVLYYDPSSKRVINAMAQTRQSTAKKGQGHSVHKEDRGNDLLVLQRNSVDFKERNTTVNAVCYASLLHKLHNAIKER